MASSKVAVVDSDPAALQWAVTRLASFGFEVVTYEQSFGIQNFVAKAMPAVLVLDVKMPAVNGAAICKLIKTNERTRGVRVLLYSAMPDGELASLAELNSADGYLVKSADAADLARHIRKLLNSKGEPAAVPKLPPNRL